MKPSPALREDLIIISSEEEGATVYLIKDPSSGEVFEFGEAEYFLLRKLSGSDQRSNIIREFKAQFAELLTFEQLDAFVHMVSGWGLLNDTSSVATRHQARLEASGMPVVEPTSHEDGSAPADNPWLRSEHQEYTEAYEDYVDEGFEPHGQGAGGGALPPDLSMQTFGHWHLFDSDGFFYILSGWLRPLRYTVYALPFLCIIAAIGLFQNLRYLAVDINAFLKPLPLLQHLLFSMVTVNLITQLGRGVTGSHFGVETPSFGIRLLFGILPRFNVVLGDFEWLPKNQKLWVYASPMLGRLWLFSLGIFLWLMARNTGTQLSYIALGIAMFSTFSLILVANPLIKTSGYHVLSTLMGMPNLKQKANRALFARFSKRATALVDDDESQFALRMYALASFLFLFAVVGVVGIVAARWLELNYQGTGVALFLTVFTYLVLRFRRQMRHRRAIMRTNRGAGGNRGPGVPQRAPRPAEEMARAPRRPPPPPRKPVSTGGRIVRYVLLIGFIACMFLPYQYETGGPAQILPLQQFEIHGQTEGIIEEVYFNGGEWVEKGTTVAKLSSHTQMKDFLTTKAALQKQRAKLSELQNTPRPEELAVAEDKLSTAEVRAKFSAENAARLERLYAQQNVSLDQVEDAKRERDVHKMEVEEARTNLSLIRSGPHPKEIEAAEAEQQRLEEQLKYDEEQLGRTILKMPFDGRIVTADLDLSVGQYLDEGDLFATVANDRQVRIKLAIPQADIGEVAVGAAARLKVWTYPDRQFFGELAEIEPVVSESDQGKVINVISIMSNEEGLLSPGMSGFGKVEGDTKPVIVAFTRMIVRFVLVEAWSWLP